jgi:hypothetical protein
MTASLWRPMRVPLDSKPQRQLLRQLRLLSGRLLSLRCTACGGLLSQIGLPALLRRGPDVDGENAMNEGGSRVQR